MDLKLSPSWQPEMDIHLDYTCTGVRSWAKKKSLRHKTKKPQRYNLETTTHKSTI